MAIRNKTGKGGFGDRPQDINRNGRGKGSISIVDKIKKTLSQIPPGQKKTYLEMLIIKILKKAIIDEDVMMIRDLIDRCDGKPKQYDPEEEENYVERTQLKTDAKKQLIDKVNSIIAETKTR